MSRLLNPEDVTALLFAVAGVVIVLLLLWAAYREGHNDGYSAGHADAQKYKASRDKAHRMLRNRMPAYRRPYRLSMPAPRPLAPTQALPLHDLAPWPDTVPMPQIVTRELETVGG